VSGPGTSRGLIGPEVLENAVVQELLAARLVGVLATFDSRGVIHAVPMWFAADGDVVWLATGSRSRKVENVQGDSRATLVVHDSRSGFEVCGASIVGRIQIVEGHAARASIELVHRRYVSEDAERHEVVSDFLASDDVALRLRPESALTWDERESAASKALRTLGAALPLVPTEPRA
jgi:nitroimidazol reductase NimA-like FMN-containing flavoprotein (pyridoxamine 5'-phosphate oxidase superfamily)